MAIELNDDLWARILYTTTRDNLTLLASLQTVNRYWRDLIISDCLLWTKIDIKHQAHLTKLAFLDVFLKRSGEAPLDILIELPDYTILTQPYILLCRLQQVATRIKSLRLSLYNYQLIESFILGIGQGQPAPYLEKLSITTKSPDSIFFMSDTTFPSLESAFTPSPRLRHLTIPSWPLPKSIQAIPQLSTITTFLIDVSSQPMDMDCALELLKAAHVLEHLSFNGYNLVSWGSVGSATDTARIIEMPHLRSVNLSAPGYGIELLRNISAPLLEKITLYDWPSKDGYENNGAHWDDTLSSIISDTLERTSKRSPNVTHLYLKQIRLFDPIADYKRIFSRKWFPKLNEALFQETEICDAILWEIAEDLNTQNSVNLVLFIRCEGITAEGVIKFMEKKKDNINRARR